MAHADGAEDRRGVGGAVVSRGEIFALRAFQVVFGVVALYDLMVGAYLLLASEPWWAHGAGTVWGALPGLGVEGDGLHPAAESLLRRLGALQMAAGGMLGGVVYASRFDVRVVDVTLAVIAVVGGGLAWTDAVWFDGTVYLTTKRGIGAVTTAVLLAWFGVRGRRAWARRRAAG